MLIMINSIPGFTSHHTIVDPREVAEEERDEEVEDDEVGDEDDGEEIGNAHVALFRDVPAVPHRLDPLTAQHAEHDHETDVCSLQCTHHKYK